MVFRTADKMAAAKVRTSSHYPFEKGYCWMTGPFEQKEDWCHFGTQQYANTPTVSPISSFLLVDATMILKIRFDGFGKDCHFWRWFSNSSKLWEEWKLFF
ncbi:hypothetical protein TNCT_69311 [Trichonephila clavata]|uniref:Uncharacterized protein n=1 Tax=Trichonephila clavata TaxID=2740835 RepID=A0A8X6KFC4_TRICU|nr:hypothetical protein TNCT_69311 [Trichonephila clavata]